MRANLYVGNSSWGEVEFPEGVIPRVNETFETAEQKYYIKEIVWRYSSYSELQLIIYMVPIDLSY